jgi:hypothetical protein
MTLAVRHKSLRSILPPYDVYLWDPFSIWHVVPEPVGPVSMSIWPVGPDGLHVTCACGPFSIQVVGSDGLCVTCTYGTIRPLGPNDLHIMCTYGTFLHLHPTCVTWWLACHLLPLWFNKFKLKRNHETWESNPRPRVRNRPSSPLR